MKKLYHVADRRNLPSILKHGLIPRQPDLGLRPMKRDTKGVYLWDCLELAQFWCDEDQIVVEAHLPTQAKVSRRRPTCTEAYEYIVLERIPPENLRVIPSFQPATCKRNCGLKQGCFYLKTHNIEAEK